ncbi:discoidin domain-containing protein [Lysinibacillus fusiformis]|uniref:discoidin domain-containing protein n=1 Tax=Lysinibacillus fusiformis TaxID=28031 RepID=UPI00187ED0A6|nr:discoidin domain-containing protein [Lysinibacillus fusiformis]MBD8523962.1 discoidin domain-containing protein [Lysinibacillus fusiformis]
MATIGQQLTTAENGYKRYLFTDSNFNYSNGWINNSGSDMISYTEGSTVRFNCFGTSLTVLVYSWSNRGNMSISIDGQEPLAYKGYHSANANNYVGFVATGLTDRWHTVIITVLSSLGTLRAVDVQSNGLGISTYDESVVKKDRTLILHNDKYKKWNPEVKGGYFSVVPAMTSATTPTGIVEQSSIWGSGYEGFRAFDKKLNVHANGAWHTGQTNGAVPQWISYDIGKLKRVVRVAITARLDSYVTTQGVKNFIVQAYENGTYVDLAEFNTIPWVAGETRTFDFNNSKHYQKYRLYIKWTYGTSAFAITEIDFLESVIELSAHWSAYDTETISTFHDFLEWGMEDRNIFERKSSELPPIPLINITQNITSHEQGSAYSQSLNLSKYTSIQSLKI